MSAAPALCAEPGCLRVTGHAGSHSATPGEAWGFLGEKDKKKLGKAGFATPRGGHKGGYQNHVIRSNTVIIPFERLQEADLSKYLDGYVIRLYPDQYFEAKLKPRPEFTAIDALVKVGKNAFVLYGSYQAWDDYPPLKTWKVRSLTKDGERERRSEI